MTEITKIGHFLPVDAEGYLLNECRLENIHPPWTEAVEEIKQAYLLHHRQHIHSLYLRGSVPRGMGIPGVSDLDTLCVLRDDATGFNFSWIKDFQAEVKKKHPFVFDFEFYFLKQNDLLTSTDHFVFRFILKTLSLCIYGEDLAQQIPRFKPSRKLAVAFHGNIENEIIETIQFLGREKNPEIIKKHCTWIMKRILRTGLAILMEKEHVYTRDLYPCYEIFVKNYPQKQTEMRQALEYAINPIADTKPLAEFLNNIHPWFISEVHRILFGV